MPVTPQKAAGWRMDPPVSEPKAYHPMPAATAAALPPVFPIRCCASALVIGALGFFLCLALNAWQQASQGDDPVARKSAAANLCASVLVLAAALLRLDDLLFLQRCQPALEESGDLPV